MKKSRAANSGKDIIKSIFGRKGKRETNRAIKGKPRKKGYK